MIRPPDEMPSKMGLSPLEWTPLQIAAFHGNRKICEYLIEKNANPELYNSYRKNAIDLAKDDEVKAVLLAGRSCVCLAKST